MAPEARSQDARRIDDFLEAVNQRWDGISDDLAQLKVMMKEILTQQTTILQTLQSLSRKASPSQNTRTTQLLTPANNSEGMGEGSHSTYKSCQPRRDFPTFEGEEVHKGLYKYNQYFDLEEVPPYERPALSKGYLLPEAPARLPSFHTCVGANEEKLIPKWYKEHGIELILGTRVKSVDVRRKTLLTAVGETISYKILIIATGARALKLEEFGVSGSDAENVCYLRDLGDANRVVDVMQSCASGNAVVIGGGYIGMECAASLVTNRINVTMVFPEVHCMARLFTPKIASYYEGYYSSKGVQFVKGTVLTSFEIDPIGKITAVNLRDGSQLPADMVVVGIGIRPNTSLFEGQLTLEKGGIKVNGQMQTSNTSVYAVGDVAAFPVKLFGETRRLEHVDSARKTAKHAVSAIMEPEKTDEFDYLPFFYSRFFTFSWQFYGDNAGEVVHFGDYSGNTIGAYWISKGHLVGSFLEGGTKEEYEALAKTTRLKPAIDDITDLERQGLGFAVTVSKKPLTPPPSDDVSGSTLVLERPLFAWHATAGVITAASIAAFAYWYGRRRRRW